MAKRICAINIKPEEMRTMSIKQLCEALDCSKSTVNRKLQGFRSEVQKGRYGDYALVESGRIIRVSSLAFWDYLVYEERLNEKYLRKYVPPFSPRKVREYI